TAGPLPSGINPQPVYEADVEHHITYRRQMIVTSPHPEGPYSEPVWIDEDGIDPCLFHDEDGRNYMLLNRGARILELDKDCKKQISPARMLCYGDNKRAPEGPHLFKKDGYYYLLLAEGGTGHGHRVSIFRSRDLMGCYEPCPFNPILRQWLEDAPIQRCGHGELVDTPDGRWYMAYLCGRKKGDYTILGRETALEPVEWTAEGWPIVNRGRGPSAINKKPFPEGNLNTAPAGRQEALAGRQEASAEYKEDSCVTTLPTDFLSPRPWLEGGVSYEGAGDGTGVWTLQASPAPFDTVQARNLMLRRQLSFEEDVQVVLETVGDMPEGAMAGLLGYYDENSFLFFGLTMEKGAKKLLLWQHIGTDDEKEIFDLPSQETCGILLRMEVRGLSRRFLYETEKKRCLVKTLEKVTYLSDEGVSMGKRFTGVLSGMGVYAGGKPLQATFREFRREDATL
ncbi:MAG: family 43 glycosylhydrolase, partial [Lachnospiraceae bacterium]|nr:family 43 glycosylhydrolase [Lachnospiraceae bacterium]